MRITVFLSIFLTVQVLTAQHIGYLIPAGGSPGETVELLIGGQQLGGVRDVRVTGGGITVEAVENVPSLPNISGKQQRFVTAWMRNIVSGKKEMPPKPDDEEELKNWRKHPYFDRIDQLTPLQFHLLSNHMFVRRNSLQMSPSINQKVIVKLKIAPDAEPGRRELRLVRGSQTATNPLPFYVDPLPGVLEPFLPVPPRKREKYRFLIPSVINGQIMPGEIDRWFFDAKKGQRLVFQTFARAMIPFMGDCVPGYFQCILELRDSKNRRIAFADDNGFEPDPVLSCTIPEDGEYSLLVRDALYRGRADFVYRIRVREGRAPEFKIRAPELKLPLKESSEAGKERKTVFPVLLQGCIARPGQTDRFVIHAEKGEKIVGEVYARRQGSQLDSRLTVIGPDGKQAAFNDDFKRYLAGPLLQHTDSWLCFEAPAAGDYTFLLTDTSGLGGENYSYFLRIDHPRPSFNLYVAPSSKRVFINGAAPLKIKVEALDGFRGDIRLRLKAPNQYFIIGSDVIPAGCGETVITLSCKDKNVKLVKGELSAEHEVVKFTCCSCCNPKIRGRVICGDEDTQAFAYTHLIPAREWLLSKTWGPAGCGNVMLNNPKQKNLVIPAGKSARLKLRRRKLPRGASVEFALHDAPKGLTLAKTEVKERNRGWAEITLVFHAAADVKPARFNQLIKCIYHFQSRPDKEGKVFPRKSEFFLPALLFEINGD